MLQTDTIAISIGDGHHGTSIMLPRGHELVKHLEALIPGTSMQRSFSPTAPSMFRPTMDSLASLASMSRQPLASGPMKPHYVYNSDPAFHDVTPVHSTYRPSSPYHSDSSLSSSSSHSQSHSFESKLSGTKRNRTGASETRGKKCQISDCQKISVSRGLCRGHGGGRRCQFSGCSKGAQSRSDFCWGHGGGQRCEVPNCMRSRKSKMFCVAHLNWEHAPTGASLPSGEMTPRVVEAHKVLAPRVIAPAIPEVAQINSHKLPSLAQALQKHQCVAPIRAVHSSFSRYPLSC